MKVLHEFGLSFLHFGVEGISVGVKDMVLLSPRDRKLMVCMNFG